MVLQKRNNNLYEKFVCIMYICSYCVVVFCCKLVKVVTVQICRNITGKFKESDSMYKILKNFEIPVKSVIFIILES